MLWFMPITPIAEKHRKGIMGSYYACSDYTAINPEFGNIDDFKNLVNYAHELGFKVIIDWVANHTGWDHVWTVSNPDYYKREEANGDFVRASGMDDIIELDYNNEALRSAMINAMKFWVNECDIDGFRCDLAAWVQVDFWKEARPAVETVKSLFWLGEFDELENPEYGKVFDASYSWKWMHLTENFYKNYLPIGVLDDLLRQYGHLGNASMRAWFTSNHDENSWNGTEYEKYGDIAMPLAVFSLTWNGVSLLYSGQEMPMYNKRLSFFDKDPIPWTGQYELHDFYKTLFNLRASHPALRGGDDAVITYRITTSEDNHVFAFLRKSGEREVLVLLNFSRHPDVNFNITDDKINGVFRNVFTNEVTDLDSNRHIQLLQYQVLEK